MGDPKGIGLYTRNLSSSVYRSPKQAAKQAADNGVSFIAIMAMWQDYLNGKDRQLYSNGQDGSLIASYAAAFKQQNIDVWLWGFPRGGWEEPFVERFGDVTKICKGTISGWLFDPEVYYKWSGKPIASLSMRGQPEFSTDAVPQGNKLSRRRQATMLIDLAMDALDESLGIGITSYGMAQYHKNFPWEKFGGVGWGSPQLYTVSPKQIDEGIKAWRNLEWKHIVPSVPTFGAKSGSALHDFLSNFVDGEEDISGLIFWSWEMTSVDEWRVLARWAEWMKAHLCELGPKDSRHF
jgi:hypothetical protein